MQLMCVQSANSHKPCSHFKAIIDHSARVWFVGFDCLMQYELHLVSLLACQTAVPLTSDSLQSVMQIQKILAGVVLSLSFFEFLTNGIIISLATQSLTGVDSANM